MKSKTGGKALVAPEYAGSDLLRLVLFAGILIAAATLITLMALGRGARSLTVFDISDLQGLQVKNWVTGHGFGIDGALFTGNDNPISMRCARMPLPIWTIAGLRVVFGSGMIAVNVAKAILWSLPLIASFALIQRDCRTAPVIACEMGRMGSASARLIVACRSHQSGNNDGRRGLYRVPHRTRHYDAPLSSQLGAGCSQ